MARDKGEQVELFDRWADRYDEAVHAGVGFPFAGYEATLDRVTALAEVGPGSRVLDVGIGTGNLARRFVDLGCCVWGIDISSKMLALAHAKLPSVRLVLGDIAGEWPSELPDRFDGVVSAYVFHHFDLSAKVAVLARLLRDRCGPGRRIVVGDVCVPTETALDDLRRKCGDQMDEEEHYWIADEAIATCKECGIRASYEQVSAFAGVFVFGAGNLAPEPLPRTARIGAPRARRLARMAGMEGSR
jgi:putative AdoMet-dependent methyltransferase